LHDPVDVEWADRTPALAEFYRSALTGAKVTPLVDLEGVPAGVLLARIPARLGAP